jgi:class 3 adenylate cyclase
VTLRFAAASGFATRGDGDGDAAACESLRLFAEAVGNAIHARRAKDAADAVARALAQAASLAQSIFPPHMLDAVQARLAAAERGGVGRVSQLTGAAASAALSEEHADVTIICADVVGFAALSAERSPSETMRLLDSLWQLFDTLVAEHSCYKLETALDGYVVVAGMLPARHDHAQVAVRLALELHAAAARVGGPPGLQLRVGVHCGAVTSGVVGHVRPHFACFGHTVHVASRMKSCCAAGGVQLSAAVVAACGLPPGVLPLQRVENIDGKGDAADTHTLLAGSAAAAHVRQLLDDGSMAAHDWHDEDDLARDAQTAGGAEPAAADSSDESGDAHDNSLPPAPPALRSLSPAPPRIRRTISMNDRSASSSAKAPRRTSAAGGGGGGAEFAAALLVREHSVHHFCTQLLLSNLSPIAFLLIMGHGHAHFPAVVACTALYFATLATYAARLQPPASVRWSALCIWTHTAVTLCAMFGVMHAMWTDRGSCPGLELAGCLRVYSRVVHASCICASPASWRRCPPACCSSPACWWTPPARRWCSPPRTWRAC